MEWGGGGIHFALINNVAGIKLIRKVKDSSELELGSLCVGVPQWQDAYAHHTTSCYKVREAGHTISGTGDEAGHANFKVCTCD